MKFSLISGLLATFLVSPAAAANCRLAKPSSSIVPSSSSASPSSSPSSSPSPSPACDPGPNILGNPSFGSGLNGWTPSSGSININSDHCYPNGDGTFSNCAYMPASGNTVWLGKAFVTEAGTTYSVSFQFMMGTPKPDTVQVNFYDNNALTKTLNIDVQSAASGGWHPFVADAAFQSPSGSFDVRVACQSGACDFWVASFVVVKQCDAAD